MLKKYSINALFLMSTVCVVSACSPEEDVQSVEFQVPVSVVQVGTATVEDKIVTSGTLRTREVETLTALLTGTLEVKQRLDENGQPMGRLAEGDSVKAGDEIASLGGEDLRLETRMQASQQNYTSALNDFEATQRLFERDLLTRADMDRAELTFEEAKLELERAEFTEDRSHLIASIDGVILTLARDGNGQLMANGQLVSPGQEIARIASLDELIADIDLVGRDSLSKVKVGQEARVIYHSWDDEVFVGEVLRIAPTVNERTRALGAEVLIDNSEGLLRPGMFVEVTLVSERRVDVPVVPRAALTERGGRRVVFVLRGQRVTQVDVVLGLGDDDQVEIRSGVEVGDRVVVRGLETLTDQMPVRVSAL